MCAGDEIAYRLFQIDTYPSKMTSPTKLCRKAKWSLDIAGEVLQGTRVRFVFIADKNL